MPGKRKLQFHAGATAAKVAAKATKDSDTVHAESSVATHSGEVTAAAAVEPAKQQSSAVEFKPSDLLAAAENVTVHGVLTDLSPRAYRKRGHATPG